MLEQFMTELRGAILSHYSGVVDQGRAGRLLAGLGEWGVGRMDHVDIASQNEMVVVTSAYETGAVATAKFMRTEGPTKVWTKKRQYLVDPALDSLPTLGPAEVRAYGPETDTCASFTHVAGGGYRVWRNGTVTCERGGDKKFFALQGGQTFSMPRHGSCYSDCWVAGRMGLKEERRVLATLPTSHPIMRTDVTALEGKIKGEGSNFDETADRVQKMMEKGIAENREMLMVMREGGEEDGGQEWHGHWGWWVGVTLLIMGLVGLGYYLRKRAKKRRLVQNTTAGRGAVELNEIAVRLEGVFIRI